LRPLRVHFFVEKIRAAMITRSGGEQSAECEVLKNSWLYAGVHPTAQNGRRGQYVVLRRDVLDCAAPFMKPFLTSPPSGH